MEIRLVDPDGAAVSGDLPPVPSTPALPDLDACREERRHLEERLRSIGPQRDRVAPPEARFRREPPNANLTVRARTEIARVLGSAVNPQAIDCRNDICRIPLDGAPTNWGRIGDSSHYSPSFNDARRRVEQDPALRDIFGGVDWIGVGALYLRARPARPATEDVGQAFIRKLLWGDAASKNTLGISLVGTGPIATCRERFTPLGFLQIEIVVPAVGELNADGRPDEISAHVDGSAIQNDFGKCVAAEVRKRFEGVRPPPLTKRATSTARVAFGPPPAKP
jgi:hypothetical protein